MAFGMKVRMFKPKKAYGLQGLHRAIRGVRFTAGKPELAKNGFVWLIAFPALDARNQVQIVGIGLKEPYRRFSVQKGQAADADRTTARIVADAMMRGRNDMGMPFGGNAKKAEMLVDITADELEALGL